MQTAGGIVLVPQSRQLSTGFDMCQYLFTVLSRSNWFSQNSFSRSTFKESLVTKTDHGKLRNTQSPCTGPIVTNLTQPDILKHEMCEATASTEYKRCKKRWLIFNITCGNNTMLTKPNDNFAYVYANSRGSTKRKPPIFFAENVTAITMEFICMIHTSFAIKLFFPQNLRHFKLISANIE